MVEKAKAKKPKALAKKPMHKGKRAEAVDTQEEQPVLTLDSSPRKPVQKPLPLPVDLPEDQTDFDIPHLPSGPIQPRIISKSDAEPERLQLALSRSLLRKLKEQAADEGISLDEFVSELLAESVVLRAWEIVERKNAMKGNNPMGGGNNNPRNPNNNNRNNNNNNQQGRGNKGHRGMNHQRYQSIMDDKASFLEYVRNQERNRR